MTLLCVLQPDETHLRRRIMLCPTEDRRRRFVVRYEEWYGPYFMCCGCGDQWTPEGRMERPFERGWRVQAIRRNREMYERAIAGPTPTLEEVRGEA